MWFWSKSFSVAQQVCWLSLVMPSLEWVKQALCSWLWGVTTQARPDQDARRPIGRHESLEV
jgi:hypothetical protein